MGNKDNFIIQVKTDSASNNPGTLETSKVLGFTFA